MQLSAAKISLLASDCRRFLEPHWLETHKSWGEETPDPFSRWMCRYSSIFLALVFHERLGSGWTIVGGRPQLQLNATPQGAVGIFATNGTWNDHCWLEGNGLVVDITADQFGYPPVIVTVVDDIRYEANLCERDIESDLRKLRHRPTSWLTAWRTWEDSCFNYDGRAHCAIQPS